MFQKRPVQNKFKLTSGKIIILLFLSLFLFIGLPTILFAGTGNAQAPGTGTTNPNPPSLQRQVKQQSVEKIVERLLRLPRVENEQWTITKDGRVSFSTITGGGLEKAECKGSGVKFANCVKKIVDKSGCAKITTCNGEYCGDRC